MCVCVKGKKFPSSSPFHADDDRMDDKCVCVKRKVRNWGGEGWRLGKVPSFGKRKVTCSDQIH